MKVSTARITIFLRWSLIFTMSENAFMSLSLLWGCPALSPFFLQPRRRALVPENTASAAPSLENTLRMPRPEPPSALPARITRRCPGASRALRAALPLILGPCAFASQDAPALPTSPIVADAASVPALPGASATLDAYRAVDLWLRDGFRAPSDEQPIDPPGTAGASVTVRLSGVVIGRASDMRADGASLWRAARQAMLEALERAPAERDATRESTLREFSQRATLDIQLAGRLTPLLGDTFADAALALSPGVEGVALRVGDALTAQFPGAILSTNSNPATALRACAGQLSLPPIELGALRKDHGAIAYRFRVQHLAQPRAGAEPIFLFRAGRTVPPTEVTLANLVEFANGLATRIQRLDFPGSEPLGLMGDFEPWTGRYSPLIAPPRDQALALYALARYANSPAIDAANRMRAARVFWTILPEFARLDAQSGNPALDPLAASFATLALRSAPQRPPGMPARAGANPTSVADAALVVLRSSFSPERGWSESLRPGERAVVAFALAEASRTRPEADPLRARANEAVRSLFRESTPATLVSYMPWLGWAELALTPPDSNPPAMPALLEMRDLVWQHQLTQADLTADSSDLLGGIVFTASRNPLPTAQLTRPVAILATLAFDPRFTPREQLPAELSRLMSSLRFLRQLAVDDAALHMMQEPDIARWGVRAAPWDQRLTLDATAMALLTLVETLDRAAQTR